MTRRLLPLVGALATGALVAVATSPAATQSSSAPPLVMTALNGASTTDYRAPRTPWGDPDLQGVWSSDDTSGIPRERPEELGNQLFQSDEDYAARVKQVEAGVERGLSAVGSFRGDYATRAFRQTSLVVDPPDGRMPAVTAYAETRRAPRDRGTFGNGPFNWTTDFTNYDRCITRGIVGSVLRVVYGNGNTVTQGPGVVAITYEMIHETRLMYTDGRPHVGQNIRQYMGDSRARWEGEELVVETTNLTDQTSIGGNGNGLRHSDKMKITERFRRLADDVLQYQFTIDDPMTYEKPFTMSLPLTPLSGGRLLPYDCHEGNYAVRQSLGAERAEDEAVALDLTRGIVRARKPVQGNVQGGGGRGAGAAPAPPPPAEE
jgi:hypothetical protein